MLVCCIDCGRFSLKADPSAAMYGLGVCALEPIKGVRWRALVPKQCDGFERADTGVIEARAAWLKARQINSDRGKR